MTDETGHTTSAVPGDDRPILVPLMKPEDIAPLLSIAGPCAIAWRRRLIFLEVSSCAVPPDPERAYTASALLEDALAQAGALGVTAEGLQRECRNADTTIREVIEEKHVSLLVIGWMENGGPANTSADEGRIRWPGSDPIGSLMSDPSADMILVPLSPAHARLRRVLCPMSGGPSATLAVEIIRALVENTECQVTLLYVQPLRASTAQRETAQRMLHNTLARLTNLPADEAARATLEKGARIAVKFVQAPSATDGILKEVAESYDAVLIGASRVGVINQLLFSEVAAQVARRAPVPVIVMKRRPGPFFSLARQVWERLFSLFPTLSEDERREVIQDVRRSARVDVDFSVMITAAAAIAALGLLLNSAAVIIGAMLVAPLMTTVVALGLAVTLGDVYMLRFSALSTLWGMALTIGVGLLAGLLLPSAGPTAEILSRSRPTLLDLSIALASGAAGAYALCRKDVSAALPGVAVAVALVPPLSTIGIGLALGSRAIAGGASLLFATNLIAISAAGGLIFLLLGFKPTSASQERLMIFGSGLVGLVLLLAAVTVPLAVLTYQSITETQLTRAVDAAVTTEVAKMTGVTFQSVHFEPRGHGILNLTVTVLSNRSILYGDALDLQTKVAGRLQRPVAMVLIVEPVTELLPSAPPPPTLTPTPSLTPSPTPAVAPTPPVAATP